MTDNPFIEAIFGWTEEAVRLLDQERLDIVNAVLRNDAVDLRICINLKEGVILLEAIDQIRAAKLELIRESFAPSTIVPDDGFGKQRARLQ